MKPRNRYFPGYAALLFFVVFISTGLLSPVPASAFSFNKNRIISNSDLTDWRSLSQSRVQATLRTLGGALSSVTARDISGAVKSAAQLIVETGERYRLNPKFFIVLIEKESGLVRARKTASSSILDYALGYGCPDGGQCNPDYKGFGRQIDGAGNRIRNGYLTDLAEKGRTISGWAVGVPKPTVDGITVTPANEATAVLYTYNPWVGKYGGGDPRWGGNSLFAKLWQEWFTIRYPDGSLLRARGESGIWLIKDGMRHPFHSRSAFSSAYDLDHVIDVEAYDLAAYPISTPIKYPEFSLLQSPEGGVYLLADGKKRPIRSRETFRRLGFNPEELISVTWPELALYPDGEPVEYTTQYPTGILLQSRETGGISYIENGIRHSIVSKEILFSRFPFRRWQLVSQSEIEKYKLGKPLKFKDGEIITSPHASGVYLVSNGQKLPVPSPSVFTQLGLKWQNLIWTSDSALKIHPTGDRLDYSVDP